MSSCPECGVSIKQSRYGPTRVYCSPKCGMQARWTSNRLDKTFRLQTLLAAAKNRAKSKDLDFDLTLAFLCELWNEQEGRCGVTGRSFDLEAPSKKGQPRPDAPSLDRIVPSRGYTQDNVRLVTYHANVALSEYGLNQLKELARDLIRFESGAIS